MAEIVRVGGNHPVRIGASNVLYRVQSFDINKERTLQQQYQLGTDAAVGTLAEPWRYSAGMEVNLIDTQVERALIGETTATNPVTLLDLFGATGVTVYTPDESLVGGVVESVRYSASTPNGKLSSTWRLRGTSEGAGAVIADPSTSGEVAFLPKSIMVRFDSLGSNLLRVRGMEINLQVRTDDWFQFGSESPWYEFRAEPATRFTLRWYKTRDDTTPGTFNYDLRPMPSESAPDDVEIQIGSYGAAWDASGNIQYLLPGVVAAGFPRSARVNQEAGDEISYSAFDAATGGFTAQVLV